MFLINRIFGEFIFLFVLFLICILLYKSKNKKQIKIILIIYVTLLAIISFCFKPITDLDLVRLQKSLISVYKPMRFDTLINNILNSNLLDFSKEIYFFIISKTGMLNLLQTFASIIFYSIIFYIIYDIAIKMKNSKYIIIMSIIFVMLNGQYIELISGIRTMIGFSILLLALYQDFYKKSKIIYLVPLYTISIGFHTSILPLVLIRIIILIIGKSKNIISKFIKITIGVILLYYIIFYNNYIFLKVVDRGKLYLNNKIYLQYWEYIASFFRIALVSYIYYISINKNKKYTNVNYNKLFYFIILLPIVFYYEYSIVHRYSIFLSIYIIPLLCNYHSLMNNKKKNLKRKFTLHKYEIIYYLLLIVIFLLSFTRGNMTELNFF